MASKLILTTGVVYVRSAGGTFTSTGVIAHADGSATAPSSTYTSDDDTGWWRVGSGLGQWTADGTSVVQVGSTAGAVLVAGNYGVGWRGTTSVDSGSTDVLLIRDAAGVLSLQGASGVPGSLSFGVTAAATTARILTKKITGIADAVATDVLTVTIPNGNHAAALRITYLSSNGSTDAFESSRTALTHIVTTRTTGANAVATSGGLAQAAIATVAAGATHTLATAVSAIAGAAGATNTFTVTVTIDDSGNLGSNQVVVFAEIVNAEASGITMA